MSHALDMTTGKAGIAFVGETPWHGLGQQLMPGAPLDEWQRQAGLDWEAKRATVKFDRMIADVDGSEKPVPSLDKDSIVLYRSDTGGVLSVRSTKYQEVQPRQVIEFYRDLTERHGFTLETAGSLKGGRRVWALARTGDSFTLRGGDEQRAFLLFATSYDGSMATQVRFTGVRVVCNNTIEIATRGKADLVIPHSTTFDADKVKLSLGLGDAWAEYQRQATEMSRRIVSSKEMGEFVLAVYLGLDTPDKIREHAVDGGKKAEDAVKKLSDRFSKAIADAPGAHLESARGMLWGLVQGVTRDVDFQLPSRSQDNRLNKAWFGEGAAIKQRAWQRAVEMLG